MELVYYEDTYKKDIDSYYMSKEQLEYSSHPRKMIREDRYRYYILGFEDSIMINFLALNRNEDENELRIKGLSTDGHYLRLGYGESFLNELIFFVGINIREINRISLEVSIRNGYAIGLYKKLGFVDTGIKREGKNGILKYMYLDIEK